MLAIDDLLVKFLNEGNAPPTTRSCGKTGTDLAGELGAFTFTEVHDFALRNVKAEAYMIVRIHDTIVGLNQRLWWLIPQPLDHGRGTG